MFHFQKHMLNMWHGMQLEIISDMYNMHLTNTEVLQRTAIKN